MSTHSFEIRLIHWEDFTSDVKFLRQLRAGAMTLTVHPQCAIGAGSVTFKAGRDAPDVELTEEALVSAKIGLMLNQPDVDVIDLHVDTRTPAHFVVPRRHLPVFSVTQHS